MTSMLNLCQYCKRAAPTSLRCRLGLPQDDETPVDCPECDLFLSDSAHGWAELVNIPFIETPLEDEDETTAQLPERIYIAGPMTGMPDHNFPAFHAAARRLQEAGWDVVNPAENFGGRTDLPRESYLRADVALMVECDAIAMLSGWQESKGARLEYLLARAFGMEVLDAQTLQPLADAPAPAVHLHRLKIADQEPQESVLAEAQRITSTERQNDYGHPADDFARTADMWTGILAGKLRDGARVAAMDVPLCMISVKLARESNRHKRDNLVDIAGYARTAAMVAGDE